MIMSERRDCFAGLVGRDERITDGIEEAWGQKAVIETVGVRDFAKVVARPHELIALRDDNPRALIIKSELPLDGSRDLHGAGRILGR